MNPYDLNAGRQMQPVGLAGSTAAPMNADAVDLPPDAPPYAGGPLATMPQPSPTPPTNSLSVLAAGGTNHQEAWMAGQQSPSTLPQQAPFSSNVEADLPPGAGGTYYGGPLANPKPRPSPAPKSITPDAIAHFAWGSAFDQKQPY